MGSLGFQHSRQIGVFLSGDEGVFLQVFHQHAESLFLSVLGRRCLEAVCRVCAFQFHFALSAYLFDKVACRLELDTVEVHRAGAYLLLVRHLSAGKCCRKGSCLSAIKGVNQAFARFTPFFTPKNVKLGVFVFFKILQKNVNYKAIGISMDWQNEPL